MPTTRQLNIIKSKIEEEKKRLKNIESSLKKNIVLGIDLSKRCPGIAVLETDSNKLIYNDQYPENENEDFYLRMLELKYWIEDLINIFKPSIIMLEAPFISFGAARGNDLILKMHGYIMHFCKSMGVEIYSILPASARKFLNIKPNTKENAFEWIKQKFPELGFNDFAKQNDRADSIIVALNVFNKDKKQQLIVAKKKKKGSTT